MSATLGSLISQLEPDWSIRVYERLGEVAQESSNPWNNAGTGHAALCELNYMPENADGTVERRQGRHDQRAVPGEPAVLGVPRLDRRAARAEQLHQRDAAHDVRARARRTSSTCRSASRRSKDQPLFAGMEYTEDLERIARVDPAPREEAQPQAEGRGDPHRVRHRRRLRRAHAVPVRATSSVAAATVHVEPPGHLAQAPEGRHVAAQACATSVGADPQGRARPVRVRRRRRRRARAAAALRHPRDQGLRRLPDQRASSSARRTRRSSPSTRRRSTARPPSAPRRCRCRTSTPASSTARPRCSSARTPASRPKFLKSSTWFDLPFSIRLAQPRPDARRSASRTSTS